jgi:hypothetical protein
MHLVRVEAARNTSGAAEKTNNQRNTMRLRGNIHAGAFLVIYHCTLSFLLIISLVQTDSDTILHRSHFAGATSRDCPAR